MAKVPKKFHGKYCVIGKNKIDMLKGHNEKKVFEISEDGILYDGEFNYPSNKVGNEYMFHCAVSGIAGAWVWNKKCGPNRIWVYFMKGGVGYTHRDLRKII